MPILRYGGYWQRLAFCIEDGGSRGYPHKCTKVYDFEYNNTTAADRTVYIINNNNIKHMKINYYNMWAPKALTYEI